MHGYGQPGWEDERTGPRLSFRLRRLSKLPGVCDLEGAGDAEESRAAAHRSGSACRSPAERKTRILTISIQAAKDPLADSSPTPIIVTLSIGVAIIMVRRSCDKTGATAIEWTQRCSEKIPLVHDWVRDELEKLMRLFPQCLRVHSERMILYKGIDQVRISRKARNGRTGWLL